MKHEEDIKEIKEKIEKVTIEINELKQKYENPLQWSAIDSATIEGIISILMKKCNITEVEVGAAINKYGSVIQGILGIMYEKGIATPLDIQNEIIAFHHLVRIRGLNHALTMDQIIKERNEFVEELEKIQKSRNLR